MRPFQAPASLVGLKQEVIGYNVRITAKDNIVIENCTANVTDY